MMMTRDPWFPNETGRTVWEVREKAVLGIGELLWPDVVIRDFWSVRVYDLCWALGFCGCFSGCG